MTSQKKPNRPSLALTVIDVAWGDSLLIESVDREGKLHLALIDSNDTGQSLNPTYMFVKNHLERHWLEERERETLFDFVMLSHAHSDHAQGLKALITRYGTKQFWYPKSNTTGQIVSSLLRFAREDDSVGHHEAIDRTKLLPDLGDAKLRILWPPRNYIHKNENMNSLVLLITLGKVQFLLCGDAEGEVWEAISHKIPKGVRVIKMPHHGSRYGAFDPEKMHSPLLQRCRQAKLAISCNPRPIKNLPHPKVIEYLEKKGRQYYRTDENYHIRITTDGKEVNVGYWR